MANVTKGALIKRINRKLQHRDEQLRTARYVGREHYEDFNLGRYYVVDLERIGRELGVLGARENLDAA